MIHTRGQLREAACESGLSEVADSITRLALDSLRIRTRPVEDDEIPIGASKFGGLPDLPPDVFWPDYINNYINRTYRQRGKRESLGFLAQFNLAELARCAPEGVLPTTGMLYFFCATWDPVLFGDAKGSRGAWRVLYSNSEPATLKRTLPPRPLSEDQRDDLSGSHAYPFAASHMWFHRELTLPLLDYGNVSNIVLYDAELDEYHALRRMLAQHPGEREAVHRMLGHEEHAQAACGPWNGGSERLLLQIATDLMDDRRDVIRWQAAGTGYFYINPADIEKHNFSRVSLSIEST